MLNFSTVNMYNVVLINSVHNVTIYDTIVIKKNKNELTLQLIFFKLTSSFWILLQLTSCFLRHFITAFSSLLVSPSFPSCVESSSCLFECSVRLCFYTSHEWRLPLPGLQVRVVHPAPTCSLPGATSVILLYRKKNIFRIFCPNRDLNGQAESEWIVINFGEKHDSLLVKCSHGRCRLNPEHKSCFKTRLLF